MTLHNVLDFVETRIKYQFADRELLNSALKAAHRDKEDGTFDDGNRGLARIGLLGLEMAETHNAVIVENMTLNDVNSRDLWWKTKQGRATACKSLGIGSCITQSVRQRHEAPSIAVLDSALSAIFGAVWLDCEHQNKSAIDTRHTTLEVLRQIHSAVTEEMIMGGETNPIFQERNHRAPATTSSTKSPTSNAGPEIRMNDMEAFMQNWFVENGLDYVEADPPIGNSTALEAQDGEAHIQRSNMPCLFKPASAISRAEIDVRRPTCGHKMEARVLDALVQGASGGIASSRKASVRHVKRKRAQDNEDDTRSIYSALLQLERQKLTYDSEASLIDLGRFLEHPHIIELEESSTQFAPFRFLYLAIGSWQTLQDFREQLRIARDSPNVFAKPTGSSLSASEIFNTICHLDSEEAVCILLKRYHAIQLLEEEQYHISQNEGLHIETLDTVAAGGRAQMGNPIVVQDAALIDRLTYRIEPNVQPASEEFRSVRRKVKRLRQLARRLQNLTNLYGVGILALLPSGPSFSGLSLTDSMLLLMTEKNFTIFSQLVHQEQGPLLKKLSEAVAPALVTLATYRLTHEIIFPIESIDMTLLSGLPKGSLGLFENFV